MNVNKLSNTGSFLFELIEQLFPVITEPVLGAFQKQQKQPLFICPKRSFSPLVVDRRSSRSRATVLP